MFSKCIFPNKKYNFKEGKKINLLTLLFANAPITSKMIDKSITILQKDKNLTPW